MSEGKGNFRLGAALGAVGIVLLMLNIGDFMLGWQKIADWTALAGLGLVLGGIWLELKGKAKE